MSSFWNRPANSLIAASTVFAVLVGDILVAKIQVMTGAIIPIHLGDTAQFILLLLAVVLFVIGTVQKETLAKEGGGKEK